jgi:uncharacterized protein (DUF2147 family)
MKAETRKKLRSGLLKTSFVALASAFGAAAYADAGTKNDEATLWKTQTFDAVIALKPCPGTGVCGEIHWMNPSDHKLFDHFGDKAKKGYGPVTDDDVRALCGFSPKIDFRAVGDNRWQGTMHLRGMNMTVDVDALRTSENTMRVDTSKFIIRQSETWTRVDANDPRYPKCEKPKM